MFTASAIEVGENRSVSRVSLVIRAECRPQDTPSPRNFVGVRSTARDRDYRERVRERGETRTVLLDAFARLERHSGD